MSMFVPRKKRESRNVVELPCKGGVPRDGIDLNGNEFLIHLSDCEVSYLLADIFSHLRNNSFSYKF